MKSPKPKPPHNAVRVYVGRKSTPLWLEDTGPRLTAAQLRAFQDNLAFPLPAGYGRFLMRYNGGEPVVGEVLGKDDLQDVPYQHGDAVNRFRKLQVEGRPVPPYARLLAPRENVWRMPDHVLPIGDDAGGNVFGLILGIGRGEVRFVDHEDFDGPPDQGRLLADDFDDFLMRFKTLEQDAREQEAARRAEQASLETGTLPSRLASRCAAVHAMWPDVESWLRRAALIVFAEKGHFSIHDDTKSRDVLDLALWLIEESGGHPATEAELLKTIADDWMREWKGFPSVPGTRFGLGGYAPGFLTAWFEERRSSGRIQDGPGGPRLTDAERSAIVATWTLATKRART